MAKTGQWYLNKDFNPAMCLDAFGIRREGIYPEKAKYPTAIFNTARNRRDHAVLIVVLFRVQVLLNFVQMIILSIATLFSLV